MGGVDRGGEKDSTEAVVVDDLACISCVSRVYLECSLLVTRAYHVCISLGNEWVKAAVG